MSQNTICCVYYVHVVFYCSYCVFSSSVVCLCAHPWRPLLSSVSTNLLQVFRPHYSAVLYVWVVPLRYWSLNCSGHYVDPPPHRVGSTYCFAAVSVSITPITKGTPAQIFLGGMFFVPQVIHWLLISAMTLRAFFVVMRFFTILSKYEGDFDQMWQEAS